MDKNIVDQSFDELLLNLIADYPRVTSCWLARALDVPLGRVNRHLRKWHAAQVIHRYNAGAYTNYESLYFFLDSMPEFFRKTDEP